MRYTAHTLTGRLLYTAATMQGIADAVFTHLTQGDVDSHSPLAYTYDHGTVTYPFTTWAMGEFEGQLHGTQHATFKEVLETLAESLPDSDPNDTPN